MTILGSGDLAPRRRGGSAGRLILAVVVLVLLAAGGYAAVEALTGGSATPTTSPTVQPCLPPVSAAPPSSPGDVHLVVLNGTQISGLAASVSGQLKHRGFHVSMIGNTTQPATGVATVRYGAGQRLAAQAVADQIAAAVLVRRTAAGVELDLGPRFHGLAALAAARAAARRFVAAEAAGQARARRAASRITPSASSSPTPTCSPTASSTRS